MLLDASKKNCVYTQAPEPLARACCFGPDCMENEVKFRVKPHACLFRRACATQSETRTESPCIHETVANRLRQECFCSGTVVFSVGTWKKTLTRRTPIGGIHGTPSTSRRMFLVRHCSQGSQTRRFIFVPSNCGTRVPLGLGHRSSRCGPSRRTTGTRPSPAGRRALPVAARHGLEVLHVDMCICSTHQVGGQSPCLRPHNVWSTGQRRLWLACMQKPWKINPHGFLVRHTSNDPDAEPCKFRVLSE